VGFCAIGAIGEIRVVFDSNGPYEQASRIGMQNDRISR